MACQVPPLDTLKNNQQFIDTQTLLAGSASELAVELGFALIADGGVFVPIAPFIWLALSLPDIVQAFSGRPVDQDTNSVIWAYHMSAYWPLQALGTDLANALRNGAPISDSNPAIQAQFSAWKQGTIESIQQLAGFTPGPGSPGYWQLQELINTSWVYSKGGNQAVLQVVKAIDCFTEVLTQLAKAVQPQPPPGGPPPPPTPPGGGGLTPCDSGNADQDEILDLCQALQSALANAGGSSDGGSAQCCALIVAAINHCARELTVIATALANPPTPAPPPDLTPIVTALLELVSAVSGSAPLIQAIVDSLNSGLPAIANAITNATGTDVSGIVTQLQALVREGDVKQPILDSLLAEGYLTGADAQVLQGADWADSLIRIGRTALWSGWNWFLGICGVDVSSGRPVLKPLGSTIADDLARAINFALGAGAAPLYPEVKGIIDGVVAQLQPAALPTIGTVHVDADLLLAKTLSPLLIVNAVAMVVDYFGWEISETLKQYTEWISEFVGLQEVRELKVGQMMRFGPMREAELRAKATYRQEIVGLSTMASWSARGLYDPARTRGLAPVTGAPIEQVQPMMLAAYRGLNARQMLRLVETGLFTQAEINDELTFSGMRPVSQTRMLHAAPYLATNPQRNQLIGTLEKAHIQGLMDDATLASNIDSAEANVDRNNLILQRNHWEILIQETKDLEAEYTTLYLAQAIDDPTFRGFLGGIGLQPWKANTVAAKAEARLAATLNRKAIQEAIALQKATATVERATALKNYEEGISPLPLYTAALIATGLTAAQAAAWSDLAVLRKAGNVTWIYGMQLSRSAATEKKARVTALIDQRRRQLIDQAQFTQALQALGLNNTWVNAVDASTEAMLTPKIAAFAVPVQTN